MTPEVKQTVHRLLVFDVKHAMESGKVPHPNSLLDLIDATEKKAHVSGLPSWQAHGHLRVDAKGNYHMSLNLGGERFSATLTDNSKQWSIQDDDQD